MLVVANECLQFPPVLDVIDAVESTAAFGLDGVAEGTDEPAGGDYDGYAHTTHNIGEGFLDAEAALDALLGSIESAPAVDEFTATEAASPDPHAEITADWAVADADGDLATVHVAVVDADNGDVYDEASTAVGGASAAGSDEFTIRNVDDQTFDVVLTVADSQGNVTTETRTVSESAGNPPDGHGGNSARSVRPTGTSRHDL